MKQLDLLTMEQELGELKHELMYHLDSEGLALLGRILKVERELEAVRQTSNEDWAEVKRLWESDKV